jgi:hypothetical protein
MDYCKVRDFAEARLPPGKTIDSFDVEAVPVLSRARSWRFLPAMPGSTRASILMPNGPPGGGKIRGIYISRPDMIPLPGPITMVKLAASRAGRRGARSG